MEHARLRCTRSCSSKVEFSCCASFAYASRLSSSSSLSCRFTQEFENHSMFHNINKRVKSEWYKAKHRTINSALQSVCQITMVSGFRQHHLQHDVGGLRQPGGGPGGRCNQHLRNKSIWPCCPGMNFLTYEMNKLKNFRLVLPGASAGQPPATSLRRSAAAAPLRLPSPGPPVARVGKSLSTG